MSTTSCSFFGGLLPFDEVVDKAEVVIPSSVQPPKIYPCDSARRSHDIRDQLLLQLIEELQDLFEVGTKVVDEVRREALYVLESLGR